MKERIEQRLQKLTSEAKNKILALLNEDETDAPFSFTDDELKIASLQINENTPTNITTSQQIIDIPYSIPSVILEELDTLLTLNSSFFSLKDIILNSIYNIDLIKNHIPSYIETQSRIIDEKFDTLLDKEINIIANQHVRRGTYGSGIHKNETERKTEDITKLRKQTHDTNTNETYLNSLIVDLNRSLDTISYINKKNINMINYILSNPILKNVTPTIDQEENSFIQKELPKYKEGIKTPREDNMFVFIPLEDRNKILENNKILSKNLPELETLVFSRFINLVNIDIAAKKLIFDIIPGISSPVNKLEHVSYCIKDTNNYIINKMEESTKLKSNFITQEINEKYLGLNKYQSSEHINELDNELKKEQELLIDWMKSFSQNTNMIHTEIKMITDGIFLFQCASQKGIDTLLDIAKNLRDFNSLNEINTSVDVTPPIDTIGESSHCSDYH